MTSISLPVTLPFLSPLSSFSYILSFSFPFPCFSNIKPPCFSLSFWPPQPTFAPSISHITIISSLDAKCLPYQSHFLIHSFPLATDCSISHCSTPAFNPSHPVVVMVNSISHTPLTPSPSPATSIRALIHLRERAAVLVWLRGEAAERGEKRKRETLSEQI